METQIIPGTIYLNHGRYWWRVKFPGSDKVSQLPLKPAGSRFATKDFKLAESLATEFWQSHLKKEQPAKWDGKLSTLIQKYHQHNISYYLPPSKQATQIKWAIFPLAEKFPNTQADDFTPLNLKEFQKIIIKNPLKYKWCRKIINRRIGYIKNMFKWAASEMLISIHTYTALTTVEGLRRGRTTAKESKKVLPAPADAVSAVRDVVTPVVADMIQIQLLTAMRPGELCRMRPADIDRSGNIWIYTPQAVDVSQYDHKTQYLGYDKNIPIGLKAQKILSKYLFRPPTDYCFKPAESEQQARERKHAVRKTPLNWGNRPGTNNKGTREFCEYFHPNIYRRTIERACKIAGVEHWYPHQLRHTQATEIRKRFGLDASRAVLGHKSVVVTNDYAELDLEKAKEVAQAMG